MIYKVKKLIGGWQVTRIVDDCHEPKSQRRRWVVEDVTKVGEIIRDDETGRWDDNK